MTTLPFFSRSISPLFLGLGLVALCVGGSRVSFYHLSTIRGLDYWWSLLLASSIWIWFWFWSVIVRCFNLFWSLPILPGFVHIVYHWHYWVCSIYFKTGINFTCALPGFWVCFRFLYWAVWLLDIWITFWSKLTVWKHFGYLIESDSCFSVWLIAIWNCF